MEYGNHAVKPFGTGCTLRRCRPAFVCDLCGDDMDDLNPNRPARLQAAINDHLEDEARRQTCNQKG